MEGSGRALARLLDLSRLVSRVGRGFWTGIDRVEAAYLHKLLADPDPLSGLVGLSGTYTLLDRSGVVALAERLTGAVPWGAPDLRARLHLKAGAARQAALADLRRLARAQSGRDRLAGMLARHLPRGVAWINVGHSNLRGTVFDAVHALGGRAVVLVHDTIPLDFPQFQRPGTVAGFATKMRTVAAQADVVICNSETTRRDVARHFAEFGRVPALAVAHLGVTPPQPGELPSGLDRDRPRFVALGTIEPRKNHALLLDVWAHFAETLPAEEIPALDIVGTRGWANEALFDRLDRSPLKGVHLFEHGALDDGAAAALVAGARALLMPSLAEGFGLPPAEALAVGTPVIATDLPVYREVLGNNPVYLDGGDLYSWAKEILGFARGQARIHAAAHRNADGEAIGLPTWQEHFDLVFKVI